MQMRVDAFRDVLDLLNPAIPRDPKIKSLKNVLIHEGKAKAFDLETELTVSIDGADDSCLIPCRSVLEMIKTVPGYDMLTVEQKAKKLSLSWDGGSASYDVDKVADFPVSPVIKAEPQRTVDGDTMVPALTSIMPYCATEEDRPVLRGVFLFPGEKLEVAAGDGFRIAYKSLPMEFTIDGMEHAIIPSGTIRHLARLWKKVPREKPSGNSIVEIALAKRMIDFTFEDGMIRMHFGRITLVTKLIEGNPPNVKQLIPKKSVPPVRFLAPDFERAVRRVADVARDGSGIVRLSWDKKNMEVSAKSEEMGTVTSAIPVENGESGKTAASLKYLMEYIKGKEGLITMSTKSPQEPILFHHASSPLVLIMPMFAQG